MGRDGGRGSAGGGVGAALEQRCVWLEGGVGAEGGRREG
jgi:hypothetical protein